MQHTRRVPARTDTGKNWPLFVIYARVLVQMLEDLEDHPFTPKQSTALHWFGCQPYDVAIVCAVCELSPRQVYREVARRLRATRIRSGPITSIRWELRSGKKLSEITVPPPKPCELLAA